MSHSTKGKKVEKPKDKFHLTLRKDGRQQSRAR